MDGSRKTAPSLPGGGGERVGGDAKGRWESPRATHEPDVAIKHHRRKRRKITNQKKSPTGLPSPPPTATAFILAVTATNASHPKAPPGGGMARGCSPLALPPNALSLSLLLCSPLPVAAGAAFLLPQARPFPWGPLVPRLTRPRKSRPEESNSFLPRPLGGCTSPAPPPTPLPPPSPPLRPLPPRRPLQTTRWL